MKKKPYILKAYHITKEQDEIVKKNKKIFGMSESCFIRSLIQSSKSIGGRVFTSKK